MFMSTCLLIHDNRMFSERAFYCLNVDVFCFGKTSSFILHKYEMAYESVKYLFGIVAVRPVQIS